ncbi:lasso RiPP family leader peptide-containing protein [uncultured Roseobacter sp.]|nr:lasso RiPP family leader peptide-containing protein [uncultured Roseobacter sp.]
MTKVAYEAPVLRAHGKVEAVTKGGTTGTSLDAAFPVGTPFSDVTLS